MSTLLRLEKLSLSMEEGVVLEWLVGDGDHVDVGQQLVEIETDKATEVVESPAAGVISIRAAAGAIVPVEGVLAEIGAGVAAAAAEPSAPASPATAEPADTPAPSAPPSPASPTATPRTGRVIASPAARAQAAARGVDLSTISGSGPGGRIVVADLPAAPPSRQAAGGMRGLRDAVVANVTASWAQIPHIHIGGELVADGLATALAAARAQMTVRVTATDLLVVALARALAEVPELNGINASDGPRTGSRVNLALAVAGPDGVVAPVMRDASGRDLGDVAVERARLVDAARTGTLDRADLAGGTITLSNLGALPVDFFTPVIAGPQIVMVAVGRAREVPVARDGMLGVGRTMWTNVAIDHRAADGEAGGRLLAALERAIAELPSLIPHGDVR